LKIISLFSYVDKFQYPDPSLFIMVRVSGAANFHMHHNNTFGILHIIIIGKIVFVGNRIIAITNIFIKFVC